MADYITTDFELTAIANAIRIKGGTLASLTYPSGFISAINDITTGGGNEKALIERTISGVYEDSTITLIGPGAFWGCSQLTEVKFPSCTKVLSSAFNGCTNLVFASIPSASIIGSNAFNGCSNLASATITGCLSISASAFYNCSSLSSIGNNANVFIGNGAFWGCGNLTSLNFPYARDIGSSAFYNCYKLTSVTFYNVGIIGSSAFYGCSSLRTVEAGCYSIGYGAFQSCKSIVSVSIPYAEYIGSCAFNSCSALETVYCERGNSIYSSAFCNCSKLTEAVFPKCTLVGQSAFYRCYSLSNVKLIKCSVISGNAFLGCSSLSSAYFPLCKSIGAGAFSTCSFLGSVYLPNITTISSNAFSACWRLLSLYLTTSSVIQCSANVLYQTPISGFTSYTGGQYGSIYVRMSLLNQWKSAAGWYAFSSRFVGLTDAEIEEMTTHTVVFHYPGYPENPEPDIFYDTSQLNEMMDWITIGDSVMFNIPLNSATIAFDYQGIATEMGITVDEMVDQMSAGSFDCEFSAIINGVRCYFSLSTAPGGGCSLYFYQALDRNGNECWPSFYWFFDDKGTGNSIEPDYDQEAICSSVEEDGWPLLIYDAEHDVSFIMPTAENSGTYSGSAYVPDGRVAPATGYAYTLNPYYDSDFGCDIMRINYTTYT